MLAIMTNEAANPQAPEAQVEQMYEYGYRKSNYGPDELVTDAHGNPISVVDAMLSAEAAAQAKMREATAGMPLPPGMKLPF